MKLARMFCGLVLLLGACGTFQAQTEFSAGRQALLRGEPDNALAHFERVARSDPGFTAASVSPPRSVWTYVGRAHYNAGRYAAAAAAFDKALTHLREDYTARMYRALTLLRPTPTTTPENAFNLQEVTYALREGVEPRRVAALARDRGVAFDLTRETEKQLRIAGATDFLVNELRKLRPKDASRTNNAARVAEGARELNAALTGLRGWLDDFTRNTPEGRFWDPGQELRKELQRIIQQIASQPETWESVISDTEWLGLRLEEESDRARRDEKAERQRQRSR